MRTSYTTRCPSHPRRKGIVEAESRIQVETLEKNGRAFGVTYLSRDDIRQGIVHIIGPEQGFTQPGMTLVCGDSHTSTHGAFGALAFGIGTSEVEHVLATQTIRQRKSRNMPISIEWRLAPHVPGNGLAPHLPALTGVRSDERRVGKECVSVCRLCWPLDQ